ncbi:hypothetical protein P9265_16715 [Schinkia azotoformans]|uniref:hypothetical protein n=1 Tax=Schinkia azotoformans TaxID=1454 RepID=UPI002E2044DD|nr:hypothetical protein [Schinkia azotoformans]
MDSLFAFLYTNDFVPERTLFVLPNLYEGIDIRTGSGEILASSRPDVYGNGEVLIGENGESIAHVSENVMGGTKIDFGMGEVVNSYPNIYGGETFHNVEGIIGYTAPDPNDGLDFHSAFGEKLIDVSPNISGGLSVSETLNVPVPESLQVQDLDELFSEVYGINSVLDSVDVDVVSAFDAIEPEFLEFLTEWF